MSPFWSFFVIGFTGITLIALFALLQLTRRQEVSGGEQIEKDHDFDGITELETPLPRWWYWLFVGSLVFSVVYLILYPGLGNFSGVLAWESFDQHDQEVIRAEAQYRELYAGFAATPIEVLAQDPRAKKTGGRLFSVHCAQCHGEGGRGNFGFPNLADADWQWGSAPETVLATIRDGRMGVMSSWLPALQERGVSDVTHYVISLSGRDHDIAAAERGKAHFQTICVACHGPGGKGLDALGAPDLTDDEWTYGGSENEIAFTIRNGRTGVMPAHGSLLPPERIHVLAAYVLGLSGEDASSPR